MRNSKYNELIELRKKWIKTCACLLYSINAWNEDIEEGKKELERFDNLNSLKHSDVFMEGFELSKVTMAEINKRMVEGYLEPYMDEIMNFDWSEYEKLRNDEKNDNE